MGRFDDEIGGALVVEPMARRFQYIARFLRQFIRERPVFTFNGDPLLVQDVNNEVRILRTSCANRTNVERRDCLGGALGHNERRVIAKGGGT